MKQLIAKVSAGYVKIFPELLERYHNNNDQTIVDLIADKVQNKVKENVVNMNSIKENIKSVLNENLENVVD